MTSMREKIGQLFMIGIQSEELTPDEQLIIEQYGFGGFILFSHNCGEPKQIVTLCRALWETGTELPPFIAIDQEGGRVHRLPQPFTHFPAAGLIGRSGNPDLAYRTGRAAAAELLLLGINLNFAPVLDVDSNPSNPVIGDRVLVEEILLAKLHLLVIAAEQKKRLILEGVGLPCLIELGQKRVVLHPLKDRAGVKFPR